MLNYTVTINESSTLATLVLEATYDFSESSMVDVLRDENVTYWIDTDAHVVEMYLKEDNVFFLTFFNNDTLEYDTGYLMINSRAILKGNQLNRIDVDNYLKVKKLTTNSRVIDCLNRVAVANYRLSKELRAAQVLELISKQEIC